MPFRLTFPVWGLLLLLDFFPALLPGQSNPENQQILERLQRLEDENRSLAAEVHALRQELAASRGTAAAPETAQPAQPAPSEQPAAPAQTEAPAPAQAPVDERLTILERRVDEQEQTKVEGSQKFPITLTGMVLFNAFLNGSASGGRQDPTVASPEPGFASGGGSLRQSVIGLRFQGPRALGANVSGSLYLDLFGGSSPATFVRLRVASIQMDWKTRSLIVGQDKPIISPREPNSLAQVGFSPLTGAGNLWLWQPQARFEQRFAFSQDSGLKAQVGVYQTRETYGSNIPEYAGTLAPARPSLEGRFEFWRKFAGQRRIEIAPGFHWSDTHVEGVSIPSNIYSVDWLIAPFDKLTFSGMYFEGRNIAGLGSLGQGFTIFENYYDSDDYRVRPVAAAGGWAQFSWLATPRLTFNLYGGQESDRASDLVSGEITRNLAYAANLIYRLSPNVLAGFEASQVRTSYLGSGLRLNNHYDLGLGYLF